MPLTAICFWVVYVGGVCLALLYPLAGVLLYLLVYHLNPEYQWWGASVAESGLRTSLTVAVATVIGLALRWPRFVTGARQFSPAVAAMVLLGAWALLSLTWAESAGPRGAVQAEKLFKVILFVLILVRCVQRPEHYHLVIGAWLLGVAYVVYQACSHVGLFVEGRLAGGVGGPDFAESSDLATHLVATLPMIGAAFFMARHWLGRLAALLLGAFTVNTLILTRTRNVIPGVIAICAVGIFVFPRRQRVKASLAMVVGLFLAAQLADPGWWSRMSTITTYGQSPVTVNRIDFWRAALAMVHDHPLGVGLGNFQERVRAYLPQLPFERSAHNTFLECFAELGYPGLFLLTCATGAAVLSLGRVRAAAAAVETHRDFRVLGWPLRCHLGWHATALQLGLVGYLVCSCFTTRFCAEDLWILVGLTTCLRNVVQPLAVAAIADQPDGEPEPGGAPLAGTIQPLPR